MATAEQLPILLKNNDHASPGLLHVWVYDSGDRIKRAAKVWIGFWIAAVLCIPLVVIHLLLIPAFLIAGPIVAYRRYHVLHTSEKATGICPVCHNDISIHLEPKEHLELWKYCPSCNSPLHLVQTSDQPVAIGEN